MVLSDVCPFPNNIHKALYTGLQTGLPLELVEYDVYGGHLF